MVNRFPMVAQALVLGASPQLRHMASMGGNLLQRVRCSYFRDPHAPCNKRLPGSGCGALEGINRGHAILGTSDHCIATHPSDVAVPLVALDAIVHVEGPSGGRAIPIDDFFLLPGDSRNGSTHSTMASWSWRSIYHRHRRLGVRCISRSATGSPTSSPWLRWRSQYGSRTIPSPRSASRWAVWPRNRGGPAALRNCFPDDPPRRTASPAPHARNSPLRSLDATTRSRSNSRNAR